MENAQAGSLRSFEKYTLFVLNGALQDFSRLPKKGSETRHVAGKPDIVSISSFSDAPDRRLSDPLRGRSYSRPHRLAFLEAVYIFEDQRSRIDRKSITVTEHSLISRRSTSSLITVPGPKQFWLDMTLNLKAVGGTYRETVAHIPCAPRLDRQHARGCHTRGPGTKRCCLSPHFHIVHPRSRRPKGSRGPEIAPRPRRAFPTRLPQRPSCCTVQPFRWKQMAISTIARNSSVRLFLQLD